MKPADKIELLDNEFEIPMEKELEEGLNDMCNLSQGIKEKAEARGEAKGAKGIINMGIKYGVPTEGILADLQESLDISLQKAQSYLTEFGKKTI